MSIFLRRNFWLPVACLALVNCKEETVDFSADVKPILNKKCISCHGGVKRNGGFSVLFRHEALDTTESGKYAIIPGDASHSEMISRITATDPEIRMPYKEEPLTDEEIEILTKWIDQGAKWGEHWAYVAPTPKKVPEPSTPFSRLSTATESPKNDIDYFVLDKLEKEKLKPSPEADKPTLARRLYLDLIGLPPTPEQAQVFLNDNTPDAYEALVDTLLASPHYGEKWASWWLDMARYADTKGYEKDVGRTIWRYRDWVIKALNADMPFDQFTVEQLAGDLLPDPTDDQLVATSFHRNTMNNDEGGTDDEEFRVASLIDRVNTTWEVWQSTTMACVQCHTHPYDPYIHEEYYRSMAFFNNTRDEDTEGEHPNLRFYSQEDQTKLEAIKTWVNRESGAQKEKELTRFLRTLEPKYHPHDFDKFVNGELIDTQCLGIRPKGSARLKQINLTGKSSLLMNYSGAAPRASLEIRKDDPAGEVIGKTLFERTGGSWTTISIPLKNIEGKHDLYFVFDNPKAKPYESVCAVEWIAFRDGVAGDKDSPVHNDFLALLNAKVENNPVMIENSPEHQRATHIFERGNWLVEGKEVKPEVPRSLNAFPEDKPHNRLGFAHWLTNKENPLTARTLVNRYWEQLFGYGIVETLEDFGTQGAIPSHQELLDHFSLKLMHDYKWSMKKLVKEIVMSATYRQDSRFTPQLLAVDPTNRLLARGPRVRLSAEQIKDQALAVSGLLSKKMYGKSVMPYQPEGIWNSVYNGEYWKPSQGEDFYRRTLYTYIKRTSPYPGIMTFDGSSREFCVSRRIRTNTPLQALVTLNDSSFVVASRNFARQMLNDGKTPEEQVKSGYRRIMVREIDSDKLKLFTTLYQEALKKYEADKSAATTLMADNSAPPKLAALTVVANALLNIDEVITKE